MERLDCAHCIRVREAGIIQPALIAESDSFDNQRVFDPLAGGITIPGWEHCFGSSAAIGIDLPEMAEFLVKDDHEPRSLSNLHRTAVNHGVRNSVGQAVLRWSSGAQAFGAFLVESFSP